MPEPKKGKLKAVLVSKDYGQMVLEFLLMMPVVAVIALLLVPYLDEQSDAEGQLTVVLFYALPATIAIIRCRGRIRKRETLDYDPVDEVVDL